MIDKTKAKKNDVVLMGRPNGQKAKCKIKRVNTKTCTVTLLEKWGDGKSSAPGSEWRVGWGLLWPSDGASVEEPKPEPLKYNMFTPHEDILILEAIGQLHCSLSPENLSCDGELPIHEMRRRSTMLNQKLRLLQDALGRTVSESEWHDWDRQRKEAESTLGS